MRSLLRSRRRVLTYAAVGGTCFVLQLVLLSVLVHLGTDRQLANAAAFAVSAQLNFLLSATLTWCDRPARDWRQSTGRWLAYNCTALASLLCDGAVFAACYRLIGTTAAAAVAVLGATCMTFFACNLVVFRRRGATASPGTGDAVPGLSGKALR